MSLFLKKDLKYLSAPKLLNEKLRIYHSLLPNSAFTYQRRAARRWRQLLRGLFYVKCEIPLTEEKANLYPTKLFSAVIRPAFGALFWPFTESGAMWQQEVRGCYKRRGIWLISLPSRSSEGTLEWDGRDSGGIAPPPLKATQGG